MSFSLKKLPSAAKAVLLIGAVSSVAYVFTAPAIAFTGKTGDSATRLQTISKIDAQLAAYSKDTSKVEVLAGLTPEDKLAMTAPEIKAYSDFVAKAAAGEFKFNPTLTMPDIEAPELSCLDDLLPTPEATNTKTTPAKLGN